MKVYYTDTSAVSKGYMAKHFINAHRKNKCFKSTILMRMTIRKQ